MPHVSGGTHTTKKVTSGEPMQTFDARTLFRKMSHEFEHLVYGLNQVKNELEEMQHPITRQTNEFLM